MANWFTELHLSDGKKMIKFRTNKIQSGIYRGDFLSSLCYFMCFNQLSLSFNNTDYDFKSKIQEGYHNLNHLLYIDDLEIFANSRTELNKLLEFTTEHRDSINMDFGLNKCKLVDLFKGAVSPSQCYSIGENQIISRRVCKIVEYFRGINKYINKS